MNRKLGYLFVGLLLTAGLLASVRDAVPQEGDDSAILAITTVDPPEGESVIAGDLLDMAIGVTTDPAVRSVGIYCTGCDPSETNGGTPQRAKLRVPTDGRTHLDLLLVPFAPDGSPLLGRRVGYAVQVPPSSSLDGLFFRIGSRQVGPRDVVPLEMGLAEEATVFGRYLDGRSVEITFAPETQIEVEPPYMIQLATTELDDPPSRQLTLQAQDYGVAYLRVRHGDVRAEIEVRIGFSDVQGDLNGDRRIDALDEKIIRDAIGKPANPEDPRDLNGNGVIDKGDIDILKSLSCGSAPDRSLISGGGSAKTDCFGEFSLAGDLMLDARKCVPKARQTCTDGAACDLDGAVDGACTFNARLIFNHQEVRLPKCTSPGIASSALLKPSQRDAEKSEDDAMNRMGLLDALAGIGALPWIGSLYTTDVDLRVPLKSSRQGPKKGSRTIKLQTVGTDGQKDTDTVTLQCLPPALAGPSPTPQPTMTPSPVVSTDTGFLLGASQIGAWTDGQNLFADDDLDAVGMKVGNIRPTQQVGGFGFSLPDNATVTGIEVQIEGDVGGGNYFDDIFTDLSYDGGTSFIPVYIVNPDPEGSMECLSTTSGIPTCRGAGLPGGRGTWTIGGPTDTWGRAWIPQEFSDSNFRVRMWCWARGTTPTNTCRADYVRARVFYTTPAPTPTPTTAATPTPTPSPAGPIINSVSSTVFTIGNGQQTLTISGQNFVGDVVYLQAGPSDPPAGLNISPTTGTSTRLTYTGPAGLDATGWGSLFPWPGTYYLQVETRVPGLFLRSNSVQISVRNPGPMISSISGQCRAGSNCTLSNGYDVRINGSGFVNNTSLGSVRSTKWYINGTEDSFACIEVTGPTCSSVRVSLNATRIPTPGTYEIRACNVETASGEACATGQLTVVP